MLTVMQSHIHLLIFFQKWLVVSLLAVVNTCTGYQQDRKYVHCLDSILSNIPVYVSLNQIL